jgi:AGCS family alanine or glycine:cation symporter
MVEMITKINDAINGVVWGIPMMVLILGVGLFLTLGVKAIQFTKFGHIMKNTLGKAFEKTEKKEGAVSPFKAMCTALAASIGTGNIAGVSGAIAIGGPGAVFWMWISALLGMATKYSEVTLAIHYRERNEKGDWIGGPMYYIKNGLGKNWKWLGAIFAVFGALAAFGIGNMTQINTIAGTVSTAVKNVGGFADGDTIMKALPWVISILCAGITAIVLLGGIQRLSDVCALLVPVMAVVYIVAALAVIVLKFDAIPAAFSAIFKGAFNPASVVGGAAGIGIKTAITKGVGRGIFSNEAGLGSAPIAHAAADVDHPVKQGIFGVFEVFMDTIVVCTMTALVVLLGNGIGNIEWGTDIGANLTINGFSNAFGGSAVPSVMVAICLTLFALSTVLTWSLYGQRCAEYLFGHEASKIYAVIFCIIACFAGGVELKLAWAIADTLNGLMAIPNLIALALLSPVVFKLTKEYFSGIKAKK